MKKVYCGMLIFLGIIGFSYGDYSYQNGSVCNGDVCSIQTCDVTEFDEALVVTTTEFPDADISSALYDYLIAEGEYTFANRLANSVCISDEIYTETTEAFETPEPIEECYWSVPFCGDGIIDPLTDEECDAGNDMNGGINSGCSAECKKVAYCGDEIVQINLGEQCDPLNGEDKEYCDEATCKFIEGINPSFDVSLWDPVLCDDHFNGGIIVEEGTSLDNVSMYLNVKCPGSDEYVQLSPMINDEGTYSGLLEYQDKESPKYLKGLCEINYGGCLKQDDGDICIDKFATEFLAGACVSGSGGGGTAGGSGGSGPSSGPSNFSSVPGENGVVTSSQQFVDVINITEITRSDPILHNASIGLDPLILDPLTPLAFPINGKLSKTGAN